MKKSIFLLASFLCFSTSMVLSADLKFVQIDSMMFSIENQVSVNGLKNFVNDINKQKDVNFVVFSGNNIAKPTKQNLDAFIKEANKLKSKYYIAFGNKDVSKNKKFGKKEYLEVLNKKVKTFKKISTPNYLFVNKDNIFIVMDGAKEVIPSSAGYYRPEALEWLDAQLSIYHDKNVVIFQHYPVVSPARKETRYTSKADEYLKMLEKHNNVKAIFAGNFDVNKEEKVGKIIHFATDSAPTYRVVDIIDCDTNNPTYWSTVKSIK